MSCAKPISDNLQKQLECPICSEIRKRTAEESARLMRHETECLFKHVACPHTSCDKKVPLAKLEAHVVSQHRANILDSSSDGLLTVEWPANIDSMLSHWNLSMFKLNGLMLFPMLFKRDNMYYAWLTVSTALQSEVKISLKGKKGNHSYSGQTMQIDRRIDYASALILTFTNVQAKQCITRNRSGIDVLKVTYKITNGELANVMRGSYGGGGGGRGFPRGAGRGGARVGMRPSDTGMYIHGFRGG
jgi:hypothetical protein